MRILVPVAGHDGWFPGQEVDVDEETAAKWCDGERAVRVEDRSRPAESSPRGPDRSAGPAGEQATAAPAGERRPGPAMPSPRRRRKE